MHVNRPPSIIRSPRNFQFKAKAEGSDGRHHSYFYFVHVFFFIFRLILGQAARKYV